MSRMSVNRWRRALAAGRPGGAGLQGRGRREVQAHPGAGRRAGGGAGRRARRRRGMRISAGRWPGSPSRCWRRFGVEYTLAGMDVLLHRIGWSVQVPARRAAERDEDKIAAWREDTWPVIKARRRTWAPGSCFEDESGQGLRPPKGRTWGRRGHTPGREGDRRPRHAGVAGRADRRPARLPAPADLPHAPRPPRATSARGSPRRTTPGSWTPRTSSSAARSSWSGTA